MTRKKAQTFTKRSAVVPEPTASVYGYAAVLELAPGSELCLVGSDLPTLARLWNQISALPLDVSRVQSVAMFPRARVREAGALEEAKGEE